MMSYKQIVPRSEQQVIFNDAVTTLKLEVVEAYDRKDVGKGIARVDYDVMRSLEIRIGDLVEISGNKKATTVICMPLESAREKENKYVVGIDRLTRFNARVAIGEFVNISKTNGIAADRITLKPLTTMSVSKSSAINERYLCDALTNVPIRIMDVVVIPYFKTGLAFTVIDIVSFNSNYRYVRSGAFTISTNTRFEIIY
jgi:transitional endoplasmic reticulum ATPase